MGAAARAATEWLPLGRGRAVRRLLRVWVVDPPLVLLVLGLTLFGVAMIYSAGQTNVPEPAVVGAWRRQLVWLVLALVAFTAVSRIPLRWVEWGAVPAYAVGLVLLVATLVVGTGAGTAAGTRSWIVLGPLRFQPAEAAKLGTILMLARYLARRDMAPATLRELVVPGVLVALPLGLVLLQPDLGTAQAFVGILFAALFWAGTPLFLLALLASPLPALILAFDNRIWGVYIVLVLGALYLWRYRLFFSESIAVVVANFAAGTVSRPLWDSLASYQQNRILVFLDPQVDPRGAGYHLIQSMVAVGSGGLWGKGFLEGTQKRYDFLPEQHTDFIFSVVGEELGYLGVLAALLFFGLLLARLVRLAERVADPFAGLILLGIFGAWMVHIFVNIGMTVGLVPVTGIPLPFVSYGGSFLLMSWVAVGLAVRAAHDDERSLG
ncbi:MAG: rod shape-determining protein RodA [Longimicrobiales bacterium]|nr:rod shape-determining protein RodA [Longimicrobiales bacterium]